MQNEGSSTSLQEDPLVAAAAAVRDFGHLVAEHAVDDPQIATEIVDALAALTRRVEALPARERDQGAELTAMLGSPAGDGEPISAGSHCPVTGAGNPHGLAGTAVRNGATAVGRFTFRAASAGLPDVVHGGHLAAAIDGMLGLAAVKLTGTPMVTANLEIDYLAPVPINEEVVITVEVVSHIGRKCVMGAVGQRNGMDCFRAKSLFITPRQA
jgi:acyl-coenzyme A thioesterase PaaI-like protein